MVKKNRSGNWNSSEDKPETWFIFLWDKLTSDWGVFRHSMVHVDSTPPGVTHTDSTVVYRAQNIATGD